MFIPRIKEIDGEAMVDALKLRSGRPVCLYWINENLEEKKSSTLELSVCLDSGSKSRFARTVAAVA